MAECVKLGDLDFNEDRPKLVKPAPKFKNAEPALRRMRADWYTRLQKMRIMMSNGIKGLKRDYGELFSDEEAEKMEATCVMPVKALEDQFGALCEIGVKRHPVAVILDERVKGVSFRLASQLLGLIGEIKPDQNGEGGFARVSNLWSYAGMAPHSKRVAGKKTGFNPDLKKLMYVIVTCMIKSGGFYAEAYAKHFKARQEKNFNKFMDWLRNELQTRSNDGDEKADQILGRIKEQELKAAEAKAKRDAGKKTVPFKFGLFQRAVCEAAIRLGHEMRRKNAKEGGGAISKRAYKALAIFRVTGEMVNDIKRLEAPFMIQAASGAAAMPLGVPAMTPAHRHARAMRSTGKLFLEHLFGWWREVEGLPPTKPWILTAGGHDEAHYIPPPDDAGSEFKLYSGGEALAEVCQKFVS